MSSHALRIAALHNREAVDWANAVRANGGTVSATRLRLVATLIAAYKACGWWGQMDDAALLVAENAGQALTTLKRRQLMTAVASPTFAADTGYAFNGTSQYINTGWAPATHAVRANGSNARIAVYERANVAGTNTTSIGTVNDVSANNGWRIAPRSAANAFVGTAQSTGGTFDTLADTRGFFSVSKTANSTTIVNYRNGVAAASATAGAVGTTLQSNALYIAARNNAGTADQFRATTIGYAEWGAPLSAAQELAVYTALQAFMTAVGANV